MKERLNLISSFVLFIGSAMLLATIKTSLWYQIFGNFAGPALWVPCLIYIALYRSTLETVIFCYLCAFILSAQTVMPEGLLMITCLALAISTQVFKQRIYWTGSSYIMLVCGLGALMFNFYYFVATQLISENPITRPQVIDWVIEALLTPLAAPILFPVFKWFDSITNRESSTEASAQVS